MWIDLSYLFKKACSTMGERIHIVVSKAQKERWDDFAEGTPGIDDRSDLIRTAVDEYVADAESDSELPEQLEERLDDVLVQFERLEAQLNFSNDSFEDLRQSQLDEETVEDIVEFHAGLIRDEIRDLEDDIEERDGAE